VRARSVRRACKCRIRNRLTTSSDCAAIGRSVATGVSSACARRRGGSLWDRGSTPRLTCLGGRRPATIRYGTVRVRRNRQRDHEEPHSCCARAFSSVASRKINAIFSQPRLYKPSCDIDSNLQPSVADLSAYIGQPAFCPLTEADLVMFDCALQAFDLLPLNIKRRERARQ
jgi:hypothetical protein